MTDTVFTNTCSEHGVIDGKLVIWLPDSNGAQKAYCAKCFGEFLEGTVFVHDDGPRSAKTLTQVEE
jgi:hypothetical protein